MDKKKKKIPRSVKSAIVRSLRTIGCVSILFGFAINTNAKNANLTNFADYTEEEDNLGKSIQNAEVTTTSTTSTTTELITTTQTTETTTEIVVTNVEESSVIFETYSTFMETVSIESANQNLLSQITVDSTTEERIMAAMNYFVSQGFTPEAAAGILGSIAVESGYNPSIVSSTGYYGLCQWNTSSAGGYWWYSIQDWMAINGYEWNSFEGQIRAIVECPNRGQLSDSLLEELKGLTSVDQASELVAVYYEACVGGSTPTQYYQVGYCYQELELRCSEAWIAYNIYSGSSLSYTGQKPYFSN